MFKREQWARRITQVVVNAGHVGGEIGGGGDLSEFFDDGGRRYPRVECAPQFLLESERADQLVTGQLEQLRKLTRIPESDLFGVRPDGEDSRRLDFDFHVVGIHFCGVLGEVLRCGVENPVPMGHFALALA